MTDGWDDLWDEDELVEGTPEWVADVEGLPQDAISEDGPFPVAEGQETMFGADDDFKIAWGAWGGMPEFQQEDLTPKHSVTVNFMSLDDLKAFEELVGQKIVITSSRGIWFPPIPTAHYADKRYRSVS